MIITALLIITILPSPDRTPLLDLYLQAGELIEQGRFDDSASLFEEIFRRMPDNQRAVYNIAVSGFALGDLFTADSLFSTFPENVFEGDTLLEARSSARLGNAMLNEDYAGVESVIEMLISDISTGDSSEPIRQNYEVALKWLSRNEPPPPEDNEDQDDSDENEDQEESDDNEDQEEPEDNEDQEDSGDNEDNEDNEDQVEPEDNEDQEEPEDDEEDQSSPPEESEMTPEVAQMILDMVEEAQADTTTGSVGSAIGVPNW
ncbi:MAG: hypothetical protein U9P42_01895 [Candidatus Fermentibacteria bacterium]|nr:hypothetical protein [Candidatus Fermentibacteria bacterium]